MVLALQILGGVVACVLLITVVAWIGNSSLKSGGASASTGGGDVFGAAAGFFDPGTARAMDEIKEWENTAAPLPLPDPEDQPVSIDLDSGVARITRK